MTVRRAIGVAAGLLAWALGPGATAAQNAGARGQAPSWRDVASGPLAEPPAADVGAIALDPLAWRDTLSSGAGLRRGRPAPGVTLVYGGDRARLVAAVGFDAGVDPGEFELRLTGAASVETSLQGHAVVRAGAGDVGVLRPGVVQAGDGRARAVAAAWTAVDGVGVRLKLGAYDGGRPLVARFEVLFLSEAEPLRVYDRDGDGRVQAGELAPRRRAAGPRGSVAVTASKADQLVVDPDADNRADPGDVIEYTAVVGSEGGAPASGVSFDDTPDPDTTLVPGSVNVSPLALDDGYDAVGHVTLSVSSVAQGLFANDREFLGDTFALTSPAPGIPAPTTGGGTVTVFADGTFEYVPPLGFDGPTDGFGYTIADGGGLADSGTVTFNIAGLVWFVDSTAPPGGDGRLGSPLDTLAPLNGPGGAGDPDGPNHYIFLYNADGSAPAYTGGLELESGQRLVGQGVDLIVGGMTIVTAASNPLLTNAGGDGVTLASGAEVRGLTVGAANDAAVAGSGSLGTVTIDRVTIATSAGAVGIDLAGQAGTFTFSNGDISGSGGGPALAVDGGAGMLSFSTAAISKTAGRLIDVQNKTGGAVSFSGGGLSISGGVGDAVRLQSNTGGVTIDFGAGLSLTTTAGRGIFASNGGTLNFGGTSSVSATGGAALDLSGVTLGGGGTFGSLSSSGGSQGVFLDNVSGSLTSSATSVTDAAGQGLRVQASSLNATFAAGGNLTQISNSGAEGVLVGTSTGTLDFGDVQISGGTDGVSLQNNPAGTRHFGALQVTTPSGIGFRHGAGGGAATVSGSATFTNPGGAGIDIQNASTGVGFANVTVNKGGTAGAGVNLASNAGTFAFADLDVTTSSGPGLVASNAGTVNSTSGTISATNGAGLDLSSTALGLTFDSVSSSNSAASGINLVSATGSLTVNGGSISGASGTSFNVAGGTVAASYAGSLGNTANRLVSITGHSTGALTFSGGLSSTAGGTGLLADGNAGGAITFSGATKTLSTGGNNAVTLTNNGGATVDFTNGGLAITTTGGAGFTATGGGTVSVGTGANPNTISTGAGTAVNIATTIGPGHVTFQSLNSTAASSNVAINLANTGGGQFIITGVGATAGSGGTVANKTVDAVRFSNTGGRVTFRNFILQDIGDMSGPIQTSSGHDAIHGESVLGGLTLDNVTIQRVSDDAINGSQLAGGAATTWTGLSILNSTLQDSNRYHVAGVGDDNNEGLVRINGLSGTVLVDNSTLRRGGELLGLIATGGTLDLTVQRSVLRDSYKEFTSGAIANVGRRCLSLIVRGAASASANIGHATDAGLGNAFDECATASVVVQSDTGGSASTGATTAIIGHNAFTVTDHSSTLGTLFNFPQGGVSLNPGGTGTATYNALLANNTFDEVMHATAGLGQLTTTISGAGTTQIKVMGNTFDKPWDKAWEVLADGNTGSAAVQLIGNTYVTGGVGGPGTDLDGFCGPSPALCPAPFGDYRGRVRNNGRLDLVIQNENLAPHDVSGSGQPNSAEVESQASGGTLCLHMSGDQAPFGYRLTGSGGTFNLQQGASNSGPCSGCGAALITDVIGDNGNTGGGGNPGAFPPTVVTSGTLNIVTAACSLPSGGIF